jgi:hypothetical protein
MNITNECFGNLGKKIIPNEKYVLTIDFNILQTKNTKPL